MVFTSPVFLGLFLPAMFAFYFLANNTARPYVLLVFSLLFYAWGEPSAVVAMVALMVVNYVLARAIAASGERRWLAKTLLAVGVTVDLGALVAYKYLGFLAENLLPVLKTVGLGCDVPKIALPIGISFYVFQIISYIVDVFRGTVSAQRNLFKFMLYVSLFPQLIAGPIVRYATIAQDIENRTANSSCSSWCSSRSTAAVSTNATKRSTTSSRRSRRPVRCGRRSAKRIESFLTSDAYTSM